MGLEGGAPPGRDPYSANVFFLVLWRLRGQRRDPGVRPHRDTPGGNHRADGPGRQPGTDRRALFAEALVLVRASRSSVGLFGARYGVEWVKRAFLEAQEMTSMPFWWNDALAPTTLLYASLLALLAAAIAGVVPALKATGAQMQGRLKEAAAGGSIKFGGVWTVVIVGQVAVTVVFLASLLAFASNLASESRATRAFTFPAKEFLTLTLVTDREARMAKRRRPPTAAIAPGCARSTTSSTVASPRIPVSPTCTYAETYPGRGFEFILDVDPSTGSGQGVVQRPGDEADPLWVRSTGVAANYFEALGVPILAGRGFTRADLDQQVPSSTRHSCDVYSADGIPSACAYAARSGEAISRDPGYQIIGVVGDLSLAKSRQDLGRRAALPAGDTAGRTDAPRHGAREWRRHAGGAIVRRAAAEADPTLRIYDLMALERIEDSDIATARFFMTVTSLVATVALVLATAGIYALTSFTLARRTREIGIRAALGAAPRRIVTALFSRTFVQVGLGVLIGSLPGGMLLSLGLAETTGAGARDDARGHDGQRRVRPRRRHVHLRRPGTARPAHSADRGSEGRR